MKRKIYLGDSVYAQFNGYEIILTTENGFGVSNTIVLEPEVMNNLLVFINIHAQPVEADR